MKFLLDPGHGGMSFGHYLTPGKRSPEVPPGIYEGAYNRLICYLVENLCNEKVPFNVQTIAPGPINIPLAARVRFVNQLARREKNLALISVHCNALGRNKWIERAHGFVVFHSRRASEKSKRLAKIMHYRYDDITPFTSRGIKEANFTMIHKTICPAILLEMGFMTNRSDIENLIDPRVQNKIVSAIFQTMSEYADFML